MDSEDTVLSKLRQISHDLNSSVEYENSNSELGQNGGYWRLGYLKEKGSYEDRSGDQELQRQERDK